MCHLILEPLSHIPVLSQESSRRAPGYFTLIGDNAPPAARDSSEVARAFGRRCYPHTGNGEHSWCLSSSLSLSVGFSIQDKPMDVARSAPQGALLTVARYFVVVLRVRLVPGQYS